MNAIASGRDSFPLRPLALFLFTLDWFIAALLAVIGLSMVNWVKSKPSTNPILSGWPPKR